LQTEGVAGTEEDGYAINVEGIAETLCDGFDERSDLGKVAGLVGEFGEELLGGVGFAEEALIDRLLEAFGEPESEGKEDGEDAEDANNIDVALMAGVREEILEAECQPNAEEESENVDRLASESVFRALTNEDAEVDGSMDDDDIGEGDGKEQKDAERSKDDPSREVLAHVFTANDGNQDEDEEGCKAGSGSVVKNLQSSPGISSGCSHLGADRGEEVEDSEDAENILDDVNLHFPRIEKSFEIKVVDVSEVGYEIDRR